MIATRPDGPGRCADKGLHSAADWLCLAAAPTFAVMALLTGVAGGGPMDTICSHSAALPGGMVPMYVLMSAFHLAPWLELLRNRGRGAGRP